MLRCSFILFLRTSFQYGVSCLKRLNYDRNKLEERKRACDNNLSDVLVWSNERVIRWVTSINLKEYASNLLESGVHGAFIALDESFDTNSMALALQIPTQNTQVRSSLLIGFWICVQQPCTFFMDDSLFWWILSQNIHQNTQRCLDITFMKKYRVRTSIKILQNIYPKLP